MKFRPGEIGGFGGAIVYSLPDGRRVKVGNNGQTTNLDPEEYSLSLAVIRST